MVHLLTNNNLDHEAVINSESLEYVFRHGNGLWVLWHGWRHMDFVPDLRILLSTSCRQIF
jgi:hypothetical protein